VARLPELLNFGLQILHGSEAKTSFCNAQGQKLIKAGRNQSLAINRIGFDINRIVFDSISSLGIANGLD
jgi:hypothetical protein